MNGRDPKRRVIVTGANGFLGRALCRALCDEVSVLGVDLCGDGLVPLDLLDRGAWEELGRLLGPSPALLIHLAFAFSPKSGMEENNLRIVENLCLLMDRHPETILLYPSTALVYGFGYREGATEDDLLLGDSRYARIKARAEDRLRRAFPARCVVFRMTNIYGEERRENTVIGNILAQLEEGRPIVLRDFNSTRDFIYRGDVVDACRLMLGFLSRRDGLKDREVGDFPSPFGVFNVSTGQGTMIYDLAYELASIRGLTRLLPPKEKVLSIGEREYLVPSPRKLKAFFAEAESHRLVDGPWGPMPIRDGLKKVA